VPRPVARASTGAMLVPPTNLIDVSYPDATIVGGGLARCWNTGRWFGGGAGAGTYSVVAGDNPFAPFFMRKTWTVAAPQNGDTGFSVSPRASGAANPATFYPAVAGDVFRLSAGMRTSAASNSKWATVGVLLVDAQGVATPPVTAGGQWLVQNQWARVAGTVTIPAGTTAWITTAVFDVDVNTGDSLWQPGDTLDCTAALLTRTSSAVAWARP
jgi:hypothetical protein